MRRRRRRRNVRMLYNPNRSAYLDAVVPLTEQELSAALTQAMKERATLRLEVLRGVVAAAKNLKVEKRTQTLAPADLEQVVRKEIKKREEAEGFARQGNRADLVEQNRAERAVLEALVPALLEGPELEAAVRGIVAELGATALGPVMTALRERLAGRYDGKQASDVARRILAETAR